MKEKKEKEAKMVEKEQEGVKKLPQNFQTFNKLMAESVSTLVDERVRALIPFLKE